MHWNVCQQQKYQQNWKTAEICWTNKPESVDDICSHFYTTRDTTVERRLTHEVWKSLSSCRINRVNALLSAATNTDKSMIILSNIIYQRGRILHKISVITTLQSYHKDVAHTHTVFLYEWTLCYNKWAISTMCNNLFMLLSRSLYKIISTHPTDKFFWQQASMQWFCSHFS